MKTIPGFKNVLVRLPEDVHQKLKVLSVWHRATIAEMVRHMVETFYRDIKRRKEQ